MEINISTVEIREIIYNMLRNLDKGVYRGQRPVIIGLLDSAKSEALDDAMSEIEARGTDGVILNFRPLIEKE